MEEPKYSHQKTLKQILRYVKRTMSFELWYTKLDNYWLNRNLDNNWCGDLDDQKNTINHVFFTGDTTFT